MPAIPRRAVALAAALLAALPCVASARQPLFKQVDHFFAVSGDAERLFRLFRDDLQLPEAWPFRSYGDFASGAVTLGNTVMEFVAAKDAAAGAEFKAIAFEPVGDAQSAMAELDARGVRHGPEVPHTFTREGKPVVGWSTVELDGIPPSGSAFVCDYKARARVAEGQRAASDALAARSGGPLGITSLREIVVSARAHREAAAAWAKLADFEAQGGLLAFGQGPQIRVERGKEDRIEKIVVGIRLAEQAKAFLASRKMLGSARGDRVTLAPAAVGGLRIELVEE